ncbi:hypothetical protein EVAR_59919_1 [Eumeta japonica]|uniref:Uncharacterized protein n=1 Tax=Eumeta variegata TaxID=151549 RepID=A0A4C1YV27_EUMVA|nr:hypothetical protein EVAR_59919_1 [Eumeta japonica]
MAIVLVAAWRGREYGARVSELQEVTFGAHEPAFYVSQFVGRQILRSRKANMQASDQRADSHRRSWTLAIAEESPVRYRSHSFFQLLTHPSLFIPILLNNHPAIIRYPPTRLVTVEDYEQNPPKKTKNLKNNNTKQNYQLKIFFGGGLYPIRGSC